MLGISLNNGSAVGDKGFVNYTVDFSKQSWQIAPEKWMLKVILMTLSK